AVSFRMVVSQLHSTRHLQTMSLCLFAKLILPDLLLQNIIWILQAKGKDLILESEDMACSL
ncbi:MAG: hypothetical protein KH256_15670, partial [Clostridiales bacterium]|nr:hypothetical protein [Clostridiales bacterium]